MPQIIDTIDPISSAALGAAAPGTAIAAGIGSISLGGAIVGAALGSAASQLTGIALGAQVKFSWRQVAVAGITGAAGATVGQAVSGIGNGATNLLSTTQRLAAQGIFDYSVNYAASKVVGLDTAFSWKNVAGAAISSVIAGNLNTKTDLSGSIIRGIGSAASSAYVRDKWFGGGKPDYAQIVADAFGNALADYLVGTMGKPADKPGSFFQIGSGEPLDSFSYSGNSIDSSATESPFSLDTSELGTYESGPDYSSRAYIADVDTDRYLGQMSTDTNPSNPYENLVDQYSLGIGHPNSLPQSFEAIEGSSGWGFAKRLGQMIPIAGNLLIPTKSIPGEEGSLFEAVRGLIGTDDAIQNKADIEAYESRSPLGVSNEKVATAAEVTLAVTSGIKALPELAKAAEAFKIWGLKPVEKLVEGLAYRIDLPGHLKGPDGFTKTGQLSGTHNMEEAISLLEEKNATYALEKTSTNGILNLSYIYTKASGKAVEGSKTVYNPAIHADGKIFEYSLEAGKIGWQKYRNTAITPPFDVNHGGINFRVYINSDKYGNQFIGNVHPTR